MESVRYAESVRDRPHEPCPLSRESAQGASVFRDLRLWGISGPAGRQGLSLVLTARLSEDRWTTLSGRKADTIAWRADVGRLSRRRSSDEQRPPSRVCDAKPGECGRSQPRGHPYHALEPSEPWQLLPWLMCDTLTFADTILLVFRPLLSLFSTQTWMAYRSMELLGEKYLRLLGTCPRTEISHLFRKLTEAPIPVKSACFCAGVPPPHWCFKVYFPLMRMLPYILWIIFISSISFAPQNKPLGWSQVIAFSVKNKVRFRVVSWIAQG